MKSSSAMGLNSIKRFSMAWNVIYSPKADADLDGLDKSVKESIVSKVRQTKENPHHFFERLVSLPYYKLRVGDYRVIADLQEKIKIISIIRIGHRKTVYKRLDLPLK